MEKGGTLGKLRVTHNLQNDDYTFSIESAGTYKCFAMFNKGETEWIARTLFNYIHRKENGQDNEAK